MLAERTEISLGQQARGKRKRVRDALVQTAVVPRVAEHDFAEQLVHVLVGEARHDHVEDTPDCCDVVGVAVVHVDVLRTVREVSFPTGGEL